MNGVVAMLAMSVVGIQVGWELHPDGGFEYLIQIEPQTLDSMRSGQPIASELPPTWRGMRSYRITVGTARLPNEGVAPPSDVPQPNAAQQAPATAIAPPPAAPLNLGAPPADDNAAPGPAMGASGATASTGADSAVSNGSESSAAPPAAAPAGSSVYNKPERAGGGAGRASPFPLSATVGAASNASDAQSGSQPAAGTPPVEQTADNAASQVAPTPMPPPELDEKEFTSHAAGYLTGVDSSTAGDNAAAGEGSAPPSAGAVTGGVADNSSLPWLPLVGTALALFASLGANLYLGLNTVAMRGRYRALLTQLHAS